MITANGNVYWYDAAGRRYYTNVSGTPREFLYEVVGQMFSVSRTSPQSWDRGEIYAGGWHLATYMNGDTYFAHSDWLGTVRALTDHTGAVYQSYTSLPFGDALSSVGINVAHFTDQDRDTETGLDHFLFRQYSSVQGRWMTPDPAGLGAVDPSNPQTWNRYAYVANNPSKNVDALGLHIRDCSWDPCGVSWGGGGGGSSADGVEWGASSSSLGGNGMVACPGTCDRTVWISNSTGGQLSSQYFWASTNGKGNYYSYSGAYSLYMDPYTAVYAAGQADWNAMVAHGVHQEWGNRIHEDQNDVWYYTNPQIIGPPCSGTPCDGDNSVILTNDDSYTIAMAHTHPWVGGDHQFDYDMENLQTGHFTGLDYVFGPTTNDAGKWISNPNVYVINPVAGTICILKGSTPAVPARCH